MIARGYNCLIVEGPGQGSVVRGQKLYFRPDWERVVTPIIDYALTRKDIDPKRLILYGHSMGGYLIPRAAAYEHRLAACIANGGIFDFFDVIATNLNFKGNREEKEKLLSEPTKLDEIIMKNTLDNLLSYWVVTHGTWVYGVKTPHEFMQKVILYTLKDCVKNIRCPTLVIDVANEQFCQGQAQTLYDNLTCHKTMLTFNNEEGADLHCQCGALSISNQRILDWLDETI